MPARVLRSLLLAAVLADPASAAGPACVRPEVQIHKGRGELTVTCAGRVRLRAAVTFGGNPNGHKLRSGDSRTPEGDYVACAKHRSERFYRFISVSYPGAADAAAALGRGQIGKRQHEAILAAHRSRRCPPFGTALGGAIGIHGYKSAVSLAVWNRLSRVAGIYRTIGFSDGCIMVENDQMDRLWELIKVGTPIRIHGPGAK